MKEQHYRPPYYQPNLIKRDIEMVRSVMRERTTEQISGFRPEGVLRVVGISTAPDSYQNAKQESTRENITMATRYYLSRKR